ncbi:hypothetical protein [Manganibacter manganicus]|uniref:DUF4352 domain-containing protein n=1 Tax=Manganibacter manganicus TaxID=1873176 RepID=A0A1V8RMH7_9HYPH|nr:hypothetical protein [Pseudaminobacter manganicus]OQM74179.1 hypothetical protein BFN67_22360 [Pseudaminobacter manganicus]
MNTFGSLVTVLLGGSALATMVSTVPDYNSSFQPFALFADEGGTGQGRQFTAELIGFRRAGTISYAQFGQDVTRDTSATFLVVDLSVTAQSESQRLIPIWLGATGRQYHQSARLEDAPRILSEATFQPGLTDRTVAIFEVPEDEIIGGQLGILPRAWTVLDNAVHYAGPATLPSKQTMLRLKP